MGGLWQASQVLCMNPDWKIHNPLLPFVTERGVELPTMGTVYKFPIWPSRVLCELRMYVGM